jgi:hypothetical protein
MLVRSAEREQTSSCAQVFASTLPFADEGGPMPICSVMRLAAIGEWTRCWGSLSLPDTILSQVSRVRLERIGTHSVARGHSMSLDWEDGYS